MPPLPVMVMLPSASLLVVTVPEPMNLIDSLLLIVFSVESSAATLNENSSATPPVPIVAAKLDGSVV